MNTPAEWNWLVWAALAVALYGLGLLFILAICKAGGEADRRTEEFMRARPGRRGRRG